MDKEKIVAAAQTEIRKHTWDFFVDSPPASVLVQPETERGRFPLVRIPTFGR